MRLEPASTTLRPWWAEVEESTPRAPITAWPARFRARPAAPVARRLVARTLIFAWVATDLVSP